MQRSRNAANTHDFRQPTIQRATNHALRPKLAEETVIIVDDKSRTFPRTRVTDLLLHPIQSRTSRHVHTHQSSCLQLDAQLQLHLQGDSILTPGRILARDLLDESDVSPRYSRSARLSARSEAPKHPVASAMPSNDRLWLQDHQDAVAPIRPISDEPDPETPVRAPETQFNARTTHDFELLTKRRNLKQHVSASRGCESK